MPICAAPGEATLSSYRKNAVAASNANEQAPQRRRVARHRVCMRAFLRFTPLRPAHPGAKKQKGDSGISLKRKARPALLQPLFFTLRIAQRPASWLTAPPFGTAAPGRRGAFAASAAAGTRFNRPLPLCKTELPSEPATKPRGEFLWFFMISYASNPLGLFFCQRQLSSHISSKLRTAFHPSSW